MTSGKWEELTGTRTQKTAFLDLFAVIFVRKLHKEQSVHSSLDQELWKLEQPKNQSVTHDQQPIKIYNNVK